MAPTPTATATAAAAAAASLHTHRGLSRLVRNPAMGAEAMFLRSSEETSDGSVTCICTEPGRASGPPMHYHLEFEETFTCLEGTLYLDVGKRRRVELRPGESVHVPLGLPHRYFNDTDERCVFSVVATPGRMYEDSIRVAYGLAADGRTTTGGIPKHPLDLAFVFALSGSYMTGVPLWLQKGAARLGKAVARQIGYDPNFDRYLKPTADTSAQKSGNERSPG
ncbi:mannose-6-phosphate isomerase-like protein (cupin superfamily) [Variovorax boronicumulans]|uniref:cupin domain-containing protein n=1 Tax=Variovorax boronicumulans TaxID=436515 RepID=UPI002477177D|nr:cupin domain-containing protein [Variovorax boronicumulans]MDH6169984.1 mannose-6-phosphate isomerase-like protein (cupin superfamily) [Variovorax boronicumulans]